MTAKLRIGQAAEELEINKQTVKDWTAISQSRFSSDAVKPTGKRFNSQDMAMLREIQRLRKAGKSKAEIKTLLPLTPEIVEEPEPDPIGQEQPEPEQNNTSLQVFEVMEIYQNALDSKDEVISAKDQTIEVYKQENEWLRAENEQLRQPFWKKIFTSPD